MMTTTMTPEGVQPAVQMRPVWWTPDLVAASTVVDVRALRTNLAELLCLAGAVHVLLFGKPLVVTSGNDGNHAQHSAHYINAAVDIRSRELLPNEVVVFGVILTHLCLLKSCGLFDERASSSPHWHIEDAAR